MSFPDIEQVSELDDTYICPSCEHRNSGHYHVALNSKHEKRAQEIECEGCGETFLAWVEYQPLYCSAFSEAK